MHTRQVASRRAWKPGLQKQVFAKVRQSTDAVPGIASPKFRSCVFGAK